MDGAEALCGREGEALRRALALAFDDEALAARCTAEAFAAAARRWRGVATMPDPMAWVDVAAVRRARRRLAAADRRWRLPARGGDLLDGVAPRARVAVVLRTLRGRELDDVAHALGASRAEVLVLLRDAYGTLGVVDPDLDEDTVPYAS